MKTNILLIALLALTLPGLAASAVQTDWTGGSGEPGPVSSWGDAFDDYRGVDWSETGEVTLVDDHAQSRTVDGGYTNAASICTADIDGDGDEDLIASAFVGNEVAWWANDGSGGGWTKHSIDDDYTGATAVCVADMDGDGDLDVCCSAESDSEIAWWANDGSGGCWTKHSVDTGFYGAFSVAAADFDGDGDQDLCGAAFNAGCITWWENTGGGSGWIRHDIDPTFSYAWWAAVGDLDDDGDPDIVGGSYSGVIVWWANDGAGGGWTPETIDQTFVGIVKLRCGDVDGDGKDDVLAASNDLGVIAWWDQNGWTQHIVDDGLAGPWTVNSADMDDDGDLDVLGNDRTDGEVYWWENVDGDGEVWLTHEVDNGRDEPSEMAAADLDGDGVLDLCGTIPKEHSVVWWELTTDRRLGGWLEGSLLDTGSSEEWGEITWDCQAPSGTSLEVEVRAGDQVYDLGDWESVDASGDDLSAYLTDGLRYIQYRVNLSTTDPTLTPVLEEIEIEWQSSSTVDDVELGVRTGDEGLLVSWTVHGDVPAGVRVLREIGGRRAPLSSWLDGGRRAYLDRGVASGEDYRYWLEVRDDAGRSTLYGPSQSVILPEPTSTLILEEPYPSPAVYSVTITFSLPSSQPASLDVHDLAGRRVAALIEGELAAGRHHVFWSCQDYPVGVYLLRLETQTGVLTRRLVVSR
ncbi:MAG: T9SS type A sorting domain-containing protein [Candidatus Coatesbacteria bacterium]|nr:T9SS type A sorting domain-containing protein [Candidatus Coatesbacteria bacterium]